VVYDGRVSSTVAKATLGRVLVVDDDPGILRACTRVLVHEGWAVTSAGDVRTAIGTIENAGEPYDCVLSDIHMPDMDGYALVAAVRQHDDDLPVLLMTGDPSLHGAVRAIDSGAVSYITKPFTPETLGAAVARAARQHGVLRMRRRAESYARALYGGERTELEQRFARALDRSWMAFQPIVDIQHRKVFAYEALLRTDEESLRRTDLFIATAERLDRVHQLGRRVRRAVADAARDAPPDVKLFVNVHGLELADEELFASDGALAQLAPRVVLEITERTGLDPAAGPTRVAMLRKLGYRIAVDDLGAGYAALGALASLEPEVVKLDMSLIRELHLHATKRRVVGAIATMCRELGSQVVAEGVETLEERDACIEAGIALLQGYLFAKPVRGFSDVAL
jgi:EAL domain-containing protein (putative c-di-GMP-specific phosphodiesterase class I)/CheY-like chemotaxis protein